MIAHHLLTPDGISLLAVNGAAGLMLGASTPLAVEVLPWISAYRRKAALGVVWGILLAWFVALAWANSLGDGHAAIGRRWVNVIAQLYVGGLLLAVSLRERRENGARRHEQDRHH